LKIRSSTGLEHGKPKPETEMRSDGVIKSKERARVWTVAIKSFLWQLRNSNTSALLFSFSAS
jgi:hypothetical protein